MLDHKRNNFSHLHINVHSLAEQLVILVAGTIGIIAWFIFSSMGLSVAYNDAMAHMNLARLVVDNMQPGFSQLGGVWLPLNHLLFLPLVWNNWAWHSGFAGSVISIISYIISSWLLYKIVYQITREIVPSVIASLVFMTNINMLYLQATPLTEPLFIVLFLLSTYFFTRWISNDKAEDLSLFSLTGFLLVLSRYDGWFVLIFEAFIVFLYEKYIRKSSVRNLMGKLFLFVLPGIYGIGIWLTWNLLIFKDPLYFAIGPFSAHAQQALNAQSHPLITKGNMLLSFLDYSFAVIDNIGILTILLGSVGFALFLYSKIKHNHSRNLLLILLLSSPIIFNIIALFFGFSILNVPEFHWNPSNTNAGQWFNVRYGILALPLFAFLIGRLVKGNRLLYLVVPLAILLQTTILTSQGIITITDGVMGTSSFVNQDVSTYLKNHVKSKDTVLLSITLFSPVAFKSNINFSQVVHEGVKKVWDKTLSHPENFATWIVMSNGLSSDPVYRAIVKSKGGVSLKYYKEVFAGNHANVYKLKENSDYFVTQSSTKLYQGSQEFKIVGVNSYDLAYKNNDQIQTTIKQLHDSGTNTIRFWMFGDGTQDGFQPQAGIINEQRFRQADYVLLVAKQYKMRVIPVLLNNWKDYGGKQQYLSWVGQGGYDDSAFYQNIPARQLYLNYINKVLSRVNSYTNESYMDDPTILAWDLMNEPRYIQAIMYTNQVIDWATEAANYTKSKDSNHLVMFGTETLVADPSITNQIICQIKSVDICSIHFYTQLNDQALFTSKDDITKSLKNQKDIANSLNKPVLIGEVGISKQTTLFGENPLALLQFIVQQSKHGSYNGYLIWNWSDSPDSSYGFSPKGDNGKYNKKDLESILKI